MLMSSTKKIFVIHAVSAGSSFKFVTDTPHIDWQICMTSDTKITPLLQKRFCAYTYPSLYYTFICSHHIDLSSSRHIHAKFEFYVDILTFFLQKDYIAKQKCHGYIKLLTYIFCTDWKNHILSYGEKRYI